MNYCKGVKNLYKLDQNRNKTRYNFYFQSRQLQTRRDSGSRGLHTTIINCTSGH